MTIFAQDREKQFGGCLGGCGTRKTILITVYLSIYSMMYVFIAYFYHILLFSASTIQLKLLFAKENNNFYC